MKDIHDVIKHAKFGDDRFRGLGVVAGQISAFPIDFAGRPYNTLTLPCERVIFSFPFFHHPLTLSFQALNLPFLQILPTAASQSHHLQADCQEPGSAPEPYAR